MNKQVEKIRAEVEQRLNEITIKIGEARPRLHGKRQAYLDVLAFIDSQPDEQPEVELEKVVMIDNVIMNMTAEGYNNGYKTRPFYEEVLRRFNESRRKKNDK